MSISMIAKVQSNKAEYQFIFASDQLVMDGSNPLGEFVGPGIHIRVEEIEEFENMKATEFRSLLKSIKDKLIEFDNDIRDYYSEKQQRNNKPEMTEKMIEKRKTARKIYTKAKRDGNLVPQPCEECGTHHKIHGHHDDYDKPLDVRWLCASCHSRHHMIKKHKYQIGESDEYY